MKGSKYSQADYMRGILALTDKYTVGLFAVVQSFVMCLCVCVYYF